MDNIRKIKVASIQMESEDCKVDSNLKKASLLATRAKENGAELILLPELMPQGFLMTDEIWNHAEPKEGKTVKWLKTTSKELNVWLGTSYMEAEGEDFYNSFVLTNPEGIEVVRVRKQTPAAFECNFFKGGNTTHVVDTEFGKIGIGICYEGLRSYWSEIMFKNKVDLILNPLSAPGLTKNYYTPENKIVEYLNLIKTGTKKTAERLGVPVIMANKCGKWKTPLPFPLSSQDTTFPGYSAIADSDGTIKAQLKDEEGIIVSEVTLNPNLKFKKKLGNKGRWFLDVPSYFNLMVISETIGKIAYSFSKKRKQKAKKISTQG